MYVSLRQILFVVLGISIGASSTILIDYWRGHTLWPQTSARLEGLVITIVGVIGGIGVLAYLER
jgi:uncharacterized membrane protein YedE/YeeE